jgi:type I restriction enzyme M protein
MNNGNGKLQAVEYEPVPDLREEGGIEAILRREVLPHAADAWHDPASVKTGYEIGFTSYFYKLKPMRTREEMKGLTNFIIEGGAS